MTFQFINYTVIVLLTCVKQLIIINYQSLNYAVNRLYSGWRRYLQTFINVTS